jgi:hypothetical protein
VKNKDPPRCVLSSSLWHYGRFLDSKSMKSKKVRKVTPDDVKSALGILANLVKLLYEIYKIVAHR